MAPLPRLTAREVLRALGRAGWEITRQSGAHARLRHPDRAEGVTVSVHASAIVKPGTLHSILRQAGLTVEEFRALL
jgi:predicted RNA binding protein YcfA (HicA-like mRNA interferase family)